MKIVGVIPARGGSKSVPKKNIKKFCGKPLIAWTILGALKSKLNRVLVSTDDPEIAKVAKRYGAEVPFFRPPELCIDTIGIEPTLKHAYEWLKETDNYTTDGLALLMPTSPLRQTFHIDDAIKLFRKGFDSVVAVNQTPANHTPYWTLIKAMDPKTKRPKVTLWGGIPLKKILTRRQDFPLKCYARNDLIYVLKPKNLYDKERSDLYGKNVELYDTGTAYEADINTPEEWRDAELKARRILL